jgi:hypothetical protein
MKTYTIELKPARGFEEVTTDFTYGQFIETIKAQANILGLRYKIKVGLMLIAQSSNWKDEERKS